MNLLPTFIRKLLIHSNAADKVDNWIECLRSPKQLIDARNSILSGTLYEQDAAFDLMLDQWERLAKDSDELSSSVASLPSSIIPWADKDNDPTPEDLSTAKLVERALWYPADIKQGTTHENIETLLKDLAMARIRGIRCHEIIWKLYDDIVAPAYYVCVPSKYYAWETGNTDRDTLLFYPEGVSKSSNGQDWPENKFLIAIPRENGLHPMYAAKMRKLWQWFCAAHFGLSWYMQYTQQFGSPFRKATANTDIGRKKAAEILQKMGNAAWMVVPEGVNLEIIDTAKAATQNSPYIELLERSDAVCDNIILGQSLTSSRGEGGSYALGKVHEGIRIEVIKHAADDVANVINTQLIPMILRMNYGAAMPAHAPRFEFTIPGSHIDGGALKYIQGAVNLGIPVSLEYARDILKIPAPKDGEKLLNDEELYPADDLNYDDSFKETNDRTESGEIIGKGKDRNSEGGTDSL